MMEARMNWSDLVVESLRNPPAAAKRLLALQLTQAELYNALLAVAAINALLAGIGDLLTPGPTPLPEIMSSPIALFVLIAGGLVISVHVFFWAGRAIGATGSLTDVLTLLVWLQALRALAQAVILVVGLAVPALAAMIAIVVMFVGLWLFIHFLNESLRLGSLGRGVGLTIAVFAGLMIGMMFLLSLIGVSNLGIPTNV